MDNQRIILVNGAQGTVHRHCLYFPWAMDKKKVIDRRAVAVKRKKVKSAQKYGLAAAILEAIPFLE